MNNLVSVEVSGNLLSEFLLTSLSKEKTKHKYAKPKSFRWYKNDEVDTRKIHNLRIINAYEEIIARWDKNRNDLEDYDISQLRDKWLKPFFSQFGYNLQYQQADVVAGELRFPLSHRAWQGLEAPIVHTLEWQQDLEQKVDDRRHKYSPHDTLQRYLIQSHKDQWGIVTNGKEIRLLRDFHHETRKAFIKFDLKTMLDGRNLSGFRLLYRLIHPSRFFPPQDKDDTILELLFQESKEAGVAVGENLRSNIRIAIEKLANGFLESTPGLADKLVDNQEECNKFHHQILKVIYRILFLLYAEQRNLIPSSSSLYYKEYSISALRQKVEKHWLEESDFTDLWEGLKVTFEMIYKGVPELSIPNYNGLLFEPEEVEILNISTCKNKHLLEMIEYMTYVKRKGILQRISYIELGVDEIGSVYESLLDYIPRVSSKEETFKDELHIDGKKKKMTRDVPPLTFFMDPRGTSRKSSGSYYTNPGLVNELIQSALKPVLNKRLEVAAEDKQDQSEALLSLKVCDPASGSGAFLIAATEFLGNELAKIRVEDEYPSDTVIRNSRRRVLRHCIYGVDLNPLAVELCKVSLWLTAATEDKPLNFLDHHVKCGNSLIGATPELIEKGIPVDAYKAIIGDEKEICKQRRAQTRKFKKTKQATLDFPSKQEQEKEIISEGIDYSVIYEENNAAEINALKHDYQESREENEFKRKKFIADYWTAAFFWQHNEETRELFNDAYPNSETLFKMLHNHKYYPPEKVQKQVGILAKKYRFFHWYLEFPEVFAKGGFDCLLGNPPWELLQLQEKEFFNIYNSKISKLSGSKRKLAIAALKQSEPNMYKKYFDKKKKLSQINKFIKNSNTANLTSKGKTNTYSVFTEVSLKKCNSQARLGFIVPTALSADKSNRMFIEYLIKGKHIVGFYDFTNRGYLFPNTESTFSFSLITLSNKRIKISYFAAHLWEVNDLKSDRKYNLDSKNLELINPNTFNLPIFSSKKDADIILKIYKNNPILKNIRKGRKSWSISLRQGLFNMTTDNNLFKTKIDFKGTKFQKNTNIVLMNKRKYLPLYESKLISQYNHRAATFAGLPFDNMYGTRPKTKKSTAIKLSNKNWYIIPRYWVEKSNVDNRIPKYWKKGWIVGFRNAISSVADSRSAIATIIPRFGVGNSMPLVFFQHSPEECSLFLANFNSIIFDYILKQKVSGGNLNFYILRQLPFIPHKNYINKMKEYISSRVLELVYTAYDLKPFAEDMGYEGEPFTWDEERRANLKAELDAYYAKLYQLNRKQLRYILDPADLTEKELEDILDPWEEVEDPLDKSGYKKRCEQSNFPGETFRVLKEKEIREYGEYRTRRLVLEKWEEMFGGE